MTALLSTGNFTTGDKYPDIIARSADGVLHLYTGNGVGIAGSRVIGIGWNGFNALFSPGDSTATATATSSAEPPPATSTSTTGTAPASPATQRSASAGTDSQHSSDPRIGWHGDRSGPAGNRTRDPGAVSGVAVGALRQHPPDRRVGRLQAWLRQRCGSRQGVHQQRRQFLDQAVASLGRGRRVRPARRRRLLAAVASWRQRNSPSHIRSESAQAAHTERLLAPHARCHRPECRSGQF